MSSKLPRCPNGTRRNKTTKICEPKDSKKNVKKRDNKKIKRSKKTKKREKRSRNIESKKEKTKKREKRSRNIEPKKEKTKPEKEKTQPKKEKTKKPKKECPEGKVLNSKTNRCNKIKPNKMKDDNVVTSLFTPTYKDDIIDVMRNYAKQSTTKVFPYVCNNDIQKLMLIQLMETNKNGCAYDINKYGILKATNSRLHFFLRGKKLEREKFIAYIRKQYLNCATKRRMLVVPFNVDDDRHANIIIFNPFRNEVERFEPHGSETHIHGFNNTKINKDLDTFVKKLEIGLKFIPSHKTCPIGYKAYQQFDTAERKKSNAYSVPIIDPGGYCCAWSFFYADLRLKYPRLSGAEILQKSMSIMGDEPKKFRAFIHGQIKYLHEKMKNLHGDHRFARYVNWYNLDDGISNRKVSEKELKMFGAMEQKWSQYVDTEIKKYF